MAQSHGACAQGAVGADLKIIPKSLESSADGAESAERGRGPGNSRRSKCGTGAQTGQISGAEGAKLPNYKI